MLESCGCGIERAKKLADISQPWQCLLFTHVHTLCWLKVSAAPLNLSPSRSRRQHSPDCRRENCR